MKVRSRAGIDAFYAGRQACAAGRGLHTNPHHDPEMSGEWQAGWDAELRARRAAAPCPECEEPRRHRHWCLQVA